MNNEPKTNDEMRRVPTVSRITPDTLIELVYDPAVRRTALAVSRFGGLWNIEQEVKIETGETLIPYTATNNLIANECVLLPSKPVEYGRKDELIADIRSFLHRYVDLSPLFEGIAAYYVLLTWVYEAFNELPYLRLRGDFGTGKTRALLAIGSLCNKAFFASGASTVSPIFHTQDAFGGTLICDEADLPYSDARADMIKIFNNGTVRGMPVLRTVVNRHKEFNPRAFKVFGPKIIAMRGGFEDKALESRFLTEETGTRPLRSDIPIHLPNEMKDEALTLRNRLLHYRFCHFFEIKTDTSVLMDDVEPRLNQTAVSLLSLIEDKQLREEIQSALVLQNDEALSERKGTVEARVLAALQDAFAASNATNVPVRDVADRFNAAHGADYGGPMDTRWIGHVLRKRLRIRTSKSDGIYVVSVIERPKANAMAARFGVARTTP